MRFFSRETPRADWLVVGLGNPGEDYVSSRHNVGFQVANRLAKRARLEFDRKAADARLAEGSLGETRIAIAKPQTYMNESGSSVRRLLQRYRLDPSRLVVVYDDVDLPLGKIRVRERGGPGTHNGMRSIVERLGTEAFARVRCGISPVSGHFAVDADFVLTPFTAEEREAAEAMTQRAAEAVEVLVRDGLGRAMESFNSG